VIIGGRVDPDLHRSGCLVLKHDGEDEAGYGDDRQRRPPTGRQRRTNDRYSSSSGGKGCHAFYPVIERCWRLRRDQAQNLVRAPSAAPSPTPARHRPDLTACFLVSADPPDDHRTEAGRYRQRQSLPERDKRPEFGVERVQIRQRVARRQAVLVDERRRLEAPVALEGK
jgi:hypothetical protein